MSSFELSPEIVANGDPFPGETAGVDNICVFVAGTPVPVLGNTSLWLLGAVMLLITGYSAIVYWKSLS